MYYVIIPISLFQVDIDLAIVFGKSSLARCRGHITDGALTYEPTALGEEWLVAKRQRAIELVANRNGGSTS